MAGDSVDNRGNLLIAIDPAATIGSTALRERVATITKTISQSRSVDPDRPIRPPGTGSAQLAKNSALTGTTMIDPTLLHQLQELADS